MIVNKEIAIYNKLEGGRMYKAVVIEYSPKADDMAQRMEKKANEMLIEAKKHM